MVVLQGLDNYACNIFVLVHTTPPFSRDFGAFRQRLLLDLTACVRKHGAQLAAPRQVGLWLLQNNCINQETHFYFVLQNFWRTSVLGMRRIACRACCTHGQGKPSTFDWRLVRVESLMYCTFGMHQHVQVNEVPQMDGVASVLQQWVDQSTRDTESGVHAKSSHKSENGSGAKGGGNVHNANTWLFGSSDD